jgi:hypothetical protein
MANPRSRWHLALERKYIFKNFREALEFTNKVGELAEEQDHHPMIQTEWGRVTVTWWTHAIKDCIETILLWLPGPTIFTAGKTRLLSRLWGSLE